MTISRLNIKATGVVLTGKSLSEVSLINHVKITKNTNTHESFNNL